MINSGVGLEDFFPSVGAELRETTAFFWKLFVS